MPHRHGQVRIAGNRRQAACADIDEVIAGHQIDRPGRTRRGRDQQHHAVIAQQLVHPFGPSQPQRIGPRLFISCAVHRHFSLDETVLPEPAQFGFGVAFVERDHIGQAAHRWRAGQASQIAVQILAQFKIEHHAFIAEHLARRIIIDRHQDRARRQQVLLGLIEHPVDPGVAAALPGQHPDPHAFEAGGANSQRVVDTLGIGQRSGWILGVAAGHHGQQQRSVSHAGGHRPGGVLAVADRHDPGAADQADSGLEPDNPVDAGRASDRAIGFGPHRAPGHACSHCRSAAAARSARAAIGGIGVAGLPAHARPAGRAGGGADVGPFGQVGLAQHHAAIAANSRYQRGIAPGTVVAQRQTARGGRPFAGFDIVLDQHRLALQPPGVGQQPGFITSVGIVDDHRVQLRPFRVIVDRLDGAHLRSGSSAHRGGLSVQLGLGLSRHLLGLGRLAGLGLGALGKGQRDHHKR